MFGKNDLFESHSISLSLSLCRVYQAKQWDLIKVFNDHTALATGIRFGSNANYLASGSMDRSLKLYEGPSQN